MPAGAGSSARPRRVLDGAALHEWTHTAVLQLIAHTDEINQLNVYPVADSDTGTNMLFTMRSAGAGAHDALAASGNDVVAVATALAESAPDLVDRVIVSDTPAALGMTAMPALGDAVCWPVLGPAVDRLRSLDAVDKSSLQTGFAADFPIPDLAYRSLKRLTHNALCDAKTAARINEQRAVADRLVGLGKPVLVMWGEADVLTPTAPNVERYRQAGLQPVIIAGSGHSPLVEKPAEFVRVVQDFVRGAAKN